MDKLTSLFKELVRKDLSEVQVKVTEWRPGEAFFLHCTHMKLQMGNVLFLAMIF